MKNRWKTDEKPMKNRWETDEKPMKNRWETDEKPMKNRWETDVKQLPQVPICCQKLLKVAKSRRKSPKVAKSWPTVGKCCQSSPWRTPGQNVPSKPGQYVSRDIKSPQDHVCQGGHIVPVTYCPGTIYVLGHNVSGQNVSWSFSYSQTVNNRWPVAKVCMVLCCLRRLVVG